MGMTYMTTTAAAAGVANFGIYVAEYRIGRLYLVSMVALRPSLIIGINLIVRMQIPLESICIQIRVTQTSKIPKIHERRKIIAVEQ